MDTSRPQATEEKLRAELALAQQIAAGDHAAFEQLYQQTHQKIFAVCLRIVKSPTVAEDLCQQTYIQVWKKSAYFTGKSRLSTWVHRIAVNEALMYLRKNYVRMEHKSTEEESTPVLYALKRYTHSTNENLKIDLENAIAQLPAGCHKVFMLKEIQGMEHREVALIMGTSQGTSKSQLHKAKGKLRKLLQKKTNPCSYPFIPESA